MAALAHGGRGDRRLHGGGIAVRRGGLSEANVVMAYLLGVAFVAARSAVGRASPRLCWACSRST